MRAIVALGATVICLHAALTPAEAGGIYKWVDDRGITHYADRPSSQHFSTKLRRDALPYLLIGQPQPIIPAAKTALKAKQRHRRRSVPKPDCERYRTEIGKLEATLRRGYTEPTGTRLRTRKRQWTVMLQKQCY